ncbi:hypothetical protein [Naasia sp. SYSU D00057]|uniref:hypothetical protein n=1 Tax=Naasia sp. SYSU D00057 TaxID=2817380 RepID=UPI001B3073CE|nr:hypothetical protein [Naasia sp. SYSU D00057]
MDSEAPLLTTTGLRALGEAHPERRARDGGDLERLRRGVYADAGNWRTATLDEQYRLRIRAVGERVQGPLVFSHESALRMLGLPALRPWPSMVHVIAPSSPGGRTKGDVVRHCIGVNPVDVVPVGALACTSPARTALDMALSRTFADAVVVADAVFARFPGARDDFAELLAELAPGTRGIRRAARVLAFADPLSGSPGESWSRVLISELGFSRPQLQAPVHVGRKRVAVVDFEWAEAGLVGEFDGEVKYRRLDYRRGRTPEQVVIDEKNRENEIRRVRRGVIRWTWDDLRDRRRLEDLLASAGVPRRTRG